jgi:hypothetical protein
MPFLLSGLAPEWPAAMPPVLAALFKSVILYWMHLKYHGRPVLSTVTPTFCSALVLIFHIDAPVSPDLYSIFPFIFAVSP